MDRNCLKIVCRDSVLKKREKTAMMIGPAENKMTGSIIGLAMAVPTGPFATALVEH